MKYTHFKHHVNFCIFVMFKIVIKLVVCMGVEHTAQHWLCPCVADTTPVWCHIFACTVTNSAALSAASIRQGQEFSSSPVCADRLCGPPSLRFSGYRGSFPGIKWQGRDVDHWPPSRVDVKNEWSYLLFSYAFMAWTWRTLPSYGNGGNIPLIKVNFTLEQAVKAQRGSRGIALLFL